MARGTRKSRTKPPTGGVERVGAVPSNVDWAEDEVRRSKLRLVGIAVLSVKVVLVPVVFDRSLDAPFVVSKAELSHSLAWLLAATLGALLLLHGRKVFVWSPLYIPAIAFVAVNALSVLLATNPTIATFGTHARMLGFVSTLDFFILFVAILTLVRTTGDALVVGSAAAIASVPILGYEFIQMSGHDPLTWSIPSADRPFSTFGEATALAQYMTVLALGMFAASARMSWSRPWLRLICLGYSGLLLVGTIATGTRSALIGLAAGAAFLVLVYWLLLRSRRARAVLLFASLGLAVALGGLVLLSPLGARILSTVESASNQSVDAETVLEPSAAGRLVLYGIALDMVRERPLLGYGPDSFTVGVPQFRPVAAPIPFRDGLPSGAHSWIAHVATGSGLLGLACFAAIAIVAVTLVLRDPSSAFGLIGGVMLLGFLGTGSTSVNEFGTEWLFWLGVGTIAAATSRSQLSESQTAIGQRARTPRRSVAASRLAWGLVLATGVLVVLAPAGAWEASRAANASRDLRLAGRPVEALEPALRATRLDPGRAEYWDALGLSYAALNRWSEAIGPFERASDAAPYNARFVGDLANAHLILASQGQVDSRRRARELADRVVSVDSNSPQANLTRAAVMQFLGDYPEALNSVERALILDPNSVNRSLYIIGAQVMLLSGRANEAIDISQRGLLVFGPAVPSVAIRVELARALVATGKSREAVAVLDIALVIEPTNVAAQNLRQSILASLSN